MNTTQSPLHRVQRPRIVRTPLIASSDLSRFPAERSRDFVRLCRLIYRQSVYPMTQSEIVAAALAHEAPGYYVDFAYALPIVRKAMVMPRETLLRHSHGKWLEIADRCRDELASGRARDLGHALALVLSSGHASGFFLSPSTALRILQRAHKPLNL